MTFAGQPMKKSMSFNSVGIVGLAGLSGAQTVSRKILVALTIAGASSNCATLTTLMARISALKAKFTLQSPIGATLLKLAISIVCAA